MSDLRATIREKLSSGPAWTRSFQAVKPFLDRMIADGEVIRCKPPGGRGMNMVCLAQKPASQLSLTDHFAELLSTHGDVALAASQLGKSEAWGKLQFAALCERLGPQAV